MESALEEILSEDKDHARLPCHETASNVLFEVSICFPRMHFFSEKSGPCHISVLVEISFYSLVNLTLAVTDIKNEKQ
jgi:hypothetical protein